MQLGNPAHAKQGGGETELQLAVTGASMRTYMAPRLGSHAPCKPVHSPLPNAAPTTCNPSTHQDDNGEGALVRVLKNLGGHAALGRLGVAHHGLGGHHLGRGGAG